MRSGNTYDVFCKNNVTGLQAVMLATFLKRDLRTGVSEPAVRKFSAKKVFLKNSQNSQEITCVGVSFLIKFRGSRLLCSQMFFKVGDLKNFAYFTGKHLCRSLALRSKANNFIKKRLQHRCFPVKQSF